jgi:predicted ATPase
VITSVKIESFRGVREGGVEGLAPISILVGPNNQGKSTVLEAIAAFLYDRRADEVVKLLLRRGGPPLDALEQIVTRGAAKARIIVKSDDFEPLHGEASSLWKTELVTPAHSPRSRNAALESGLTEPMNGLEVGDIVVWVDASGKGSSLFDKDGSLPRGAEDFPPRFPVRFVDVEAVRGPGALEDAYTDIERAGRVETVVRALQRSMAGLRDLRILTSRDRFILNTFYEANHPPPVPAFVAGDGFKRFLEVAAATAGTPKGVVLLEEPESFQHPRYLQELATLLHLAAREGTQIILSTHSIELIDMLLLAPEAEGQTYPAVHRMSLYEGKLRATTIDREHAARVRDDLLQDLRA